MKKHLSVLLSLAIAFQPISAIASTPMRENNYTSGDYEVISLSSPDQKNSESKLSPKTKKTLKTVGIAAGVIGGVKLIRDVAAEVLFNVNRSLLRDNYEKISGGLFHKIKNPDGDDIKKQEGASWCWDACVQRCLYKYGINKSQKEIFRGSAKKLWVSPFKSKRTSGKHLMTKSEYESKCSFILRLIFPTPVFDEEIKSWVEKTTEDYTFQKLTIPAKYIPSIHSSNSEREKISCKLFKLFKILRATIALKQQRAEKDVVLLTMCPIIDGGHAITFEGTDESTEEYRYIFGEPTGGATISLPQTGFFSVPNMKRIPFVLKYKELFSELDFPIQFLIKKGQEITLSEWNTMLKEAGFTENTLGNFQIIKYFL